MATTPRVKRTEPGQSPSESKARARLSIDVSPELRRRLKIAAARRDLSVRSYVEKLLIRQVAVDKRKVAKEESAAWPALSNKSFARDWDSEGDAAYDHISEPRDLQADFDIIWADMDRLAEEIGRRWPAGVSGVEALGEDRGVVKP